ncbi:MAG TPA: hypothetical protein DCL44_07450 [Elusimicrobia bacterium]|nr:hypothetical protein [Elusimicrobiota bacterium]
MAILVGFCALALWGFDVMRYNGEALCSCPSDNIGAAARYLTEFETTHRRPPKTADEFYEFIKRQNQSSREAMHRFRTPFILYPEGIKDPDGGPVLLMCPDKSHGFLRRCSFGLAQGGMVRISPRGRVEWLRQK